MFKFSKALRPLVFDLEAYRRQLEREVQEVLARAAFQWIVTATGVIPVWSGASHGTFLDLAQAIGYNLAISPSRTSPTNESAAGRAVSDGDFVVNSTTGQFYFSYSTDLPHLVYNEYNNANEDPDPGLRSQLLQPGPYNFQVAARQAYEQEIRSFTPPNPFNQLRLGK